MSVVIKYQNILPIQELRSRMKISEREFAERAKISRSTLRKVEARDENITLESLGLAAKPLDREIEVLLIPEEECLVEYSTFGISLKVVEDGFESWKLHFMDFVDEFRRGLDPRLIILPPTDKLPLKLRALLASITVELCQEVGAKAPSWATRKYFLPEPWFIAGVEALKASALLESPIAFRVNNIFVLENFLQRA